MNLTTLPSLQKMTLLKLATRACNIQKYETVFNGNIENMVEVNTSAFKLPKSLHNSLLELILPVGMEIWSWIAYVCYIHSKVKDYSKTECSCMTNIDLQENLRWQSVGLIDKEQTSLCLIRNERVDTAFRFVLACNCCSETDMLILWQMLPCDLQTRFRWSKFVFLPVVNYWTRRLEKAHKVNYQFIPSPPFPYVFDFDYSDQYLAEMYSYYDWLPYPIRYYLFGTYVRDLKDLRMLISSDTKSEEYINSVTVGLVNVDNVAALKYFLQKFERIKRQKLLEVVARNHFISNELLVFCLSQMSDDQIGALLSRRSRRNRVISCLLNSPWKESFWGFIDRVWNDLTESDVEELCKYIINFKIHFYWLDDDYIATAETLRNRIRESGRRPEN